MGLISRVSSRTYRDFNAPLTYTVHISAVPIKSVNQSTQAMSGKRKRSVDGSMSGRSRTASVSSQKSIASSKSTAQIHRKRKRDEEQKPVQQKSIHHFFANAQKLSAAKSTSKAAPVKVESKKRGPKKGSKNVKTTASKPTEKRQNPEHESTVRGVRDRTTITDRATIEKLTSFENIFSLHPAIASGCEIPRSSWGADILFSRDTQTILKKNGTIPYHKLCVTENSYYDDNPLFVYHPELREYIHIHQLLNSPGHVRVETYDTRITHKDRMLAALGLRYKGRIKEQEWSNREKSCNLNEGAEIVYHRNPDTHDFVQVEHPNISLEPLEEFFAGMNFDPAVTLTHDFNTLQDKRIVTVRQHRLNSKDKEQSRETAQLRQWHLEKFAQRHAAEQHMKLGKKPNLNISQISLPQEIPKLVHRSQESDGSDLMCIEDVASKPMSLGGESSSTENRERDVYNWLSDNHLLQTKRINNLSRSRIGDFGSDFGECELFDRRTRTPAKNNHTAK